MPSAECPYCNFKSTAAKPVSMVNRHIKEKALIPLADDRGNHPAKGSAEYNLMAQRRGFHTNAVTEEEVKKQKQKTAFRKSEYAEKRKLSDQKKVEEAYRNLQ
jgi:hypothetical protein